MITIILVVAILLFCLITCFGLMLLIEEGEPIGFLAIIVGSALALSTMGAWEGYHDLQAEASSITIVEAERDDITVKYGQLKQQYHLVANNYKEVQLAYSEASQELSGVYGKLEGLKGNLEKAKSDLVGVKAANEFCATDLQMTMVENDELKDALRVTEGQLNTVRNLLRGN